MNDNFYYSDNNNNNINSINESHNVNKGLLLMFFSIVLIASGYIMMVSGIFDKVKKVETKIDNKIYHEYDELNGKTRLEKATKYGSFVGEVKVHPEDEDIANLLIQQIEFCNTIIINKVDYLRGQQISIDEIDKTIRRDVTSTFFTYDMATRLYNGFRDYVKWLSDSVDSDTILEEAEAFVI